MKGECVYSNGFPVLDGSLNVAILRTVTNANRLVCFGERRKNFDETHVLVSTRNGSVTLAYSLRDIGSSEWEVYENKIELP
jgi:hypothetical protein